MSQVCQRCYRVVSHACQSEAEWEDCPNLIRPSVKISIDPSQVNYRFAVNCRQALEIALSRVEKGSPEYHTIAAILVQQLDDPDTRDGLLTTKMDVIIFG